MKKNRIQSDLKVVVLIAAVSLFSACTQRDGLTGRTADVTGTGTQVQGQQAAVVTAAATIGTSIATTRRFVCARG